MNKNIVCVVLAMVMMLSFCAFAEEVAVPSVTLGALTAPEGVTYEEGFTVYVTPVAEDSQEKVVLDEIVAFVETATVAEYFGEETMTAAAAYLPEELDVAALQLDEFFPLEQEGYNAEYGDVEAVFEFLTEYEDDTTLIAMVGILPVEGEVDETGAEVGITWLPMAAEAVEGKVKITFTQEMFEKMADREAVIAILRADAVETVETAEVEAVETVEEAAEEVVETVEEAAAEVVETVEEAAEEVVEADAAA